MGDSLTTLRLHILFFDTTLNHQFTVYLNVYQTFLNLAMKFLAYLSSFRRANIANGFRTTFRLSMFLSSP